VAWEANREERFANGERHLPGLDYCSEEGIMGTILSQSEIGQSLKTLPGWAAGDNSIHRVFEFKDFAAAMEFVNRVAAAAEAANHHPDILINYNRVKLTLSSHDSGGVTQRDIRMAGNINEVAG
jgi:4a-hydroxytetrahydrobiopterin dehydratase